LLRARSRFPSNLTQDRRGKEGEIEVSLEIVAFEKVSLNLYILPTAAPIGNMNGRNGKPFLVSHTRLKDADGTPVHLLILQKIY